MLAVENITVRIGDATLLKGVTAEVRPGRITTVVGANGAGKSTLLKTASGALTATEGRVRMNGRPLEALSAREQARRRAVLPQHSSLGFSFPVFEVVLMGRTPHVQGRTGARDWQIAHAALEAVSMTDFAERAYPTLSGGEKQRVHLARALAQVWEPSGEGNPDESSRYLLLDEPTASLDIRHQHGVLRITRRFAAEGAGVLAVLHDLNLAAQYADHLVVLCRGRTVAQGAPGDVLTPACIQDAFDLPVLVQPHPCRGCPLIVPAPPGDDRWQAADRGSHSPTPPLSLS